MAIRREHMIVVCLSAKSESGRSFFEIASQSKNKFDSKVIVATTPSPERDIVLSIHLSDPQTITATLLDRIFGFAFDTDLLIGSDAHLMKSMTLLGGLLSRVSHHNKLLKYYGVKIILYVESLPESQCVTLYSFMSDWCGQKKLEIQKEVSFDIVRDRTEFIRVLEMEHWRMVHGDIKAQFAHAVSTA